MKVEDGVLSEVQNADLWKFNPANRGYGWKGVNKIGKGGFEHIDELIEISIPNSVTEIGDEAFDGCINLKRIRFNEGLESIEKRAFRKNKSLYMIKLPSSLKKIKDFAFLNCSNLKYVDLGRVERLGKAVFAGSNIEKLKFPDSLKRLNADTLKFMPLKQIFVSRKTRIHPKAKEYLQSHKIEIDLY